MEVHLGDLFTRFQEQFGSGPGLGPSCGPRLPTVEGALSAVIKSLFRAAASLFHTEPRKRLRLRRLFGIRIGKDTDWLPQLMDSIVTQSTGTEERQRRAQAATARQKAVALWLLCR